MTGVRLLQYGKSARGPFWVTCLVSATHASCMFKPHWHVLKTKVRTVEALYRSLFFLSTQLVVLYFSIIFDSVKLVLVQNMHDIFAAGC